MLERVLFLFCPFWARLTLGHLRACGTVSRHSGPLRLMANMAFCVAVKTLEANHPQTATGPCFSDRVTSTPLLTSKVIKKAIDPLPACPTIFAER
jgi:hypothetical protein